MPTIHKPTFADEVAARVALVSRPLADRATAYPVCVPMSDEVLAAFLAGLAAKCRLMLPLHDE